jgi:hypothetical protein
VGRLTSIRHPCSTWYPFTSSPTSQVSAKTGLNLQKMGSQPPILQILGAASGCGASLSKFKLLVCLLKLERFLLCGGISLAPLYIVQTERHCGSSMASREGGWKS